MNKSAMILQITSDTLDRYRSSIPRKAFTQAMERVIELTLGSGGCRPQPVVPGQRSWMRSSCRGSSAAPVRPSRRTWKISRATDIPVRYAGSHG